jgi:hypothetical protein
MDAARSVTSGAFILAVPVTIFGAVPAVLWMTRRGSLSLGRVLAAGAILGNLPFVLIVLGILVVQAAKGTLSSDVPRLWEGWFGVVRAVVFGLLVGGFSLAAFWLIGVYGAPFSSRDNHAFASRQSRMTVSADK